MVKLDIFIKKLWEDSKLLRHQIILYLLMEEPGLTKYKIAIKATGYGYYAPTFTKDLNDLENDDLIMSKEIKEQVSGINRYGFKNVYFITDKGLERLKTYKEDILAFLDLI
jgi:DNA-binding PadR family transcriptional regulator